MPHIRPSCTADARHGAAFRGDCQPSAERSVRKEFADALYARAELFGESECTCEALATISDLIARFGDEQNPKIRSTVIDAYEFREQIVQEWFRRIEDTLPA